MDCGVSSSSEEKLRSFQISRPARGLSVRRDSVSPMHLIERMFLAGGVALRVIIYRTGQKAEALWRSLTNRRSVRASIPRRADPPRTDVKRPLVRGSLHAACAIDRLRRREAANTRPRGVRSTAAPRPSTTAIRMSPTPRFLSSFIGPQTRLSILRRRGSSKPGKRR
jgi:hypothetical protein